MVVASASLDDDGGADSGAAYVFARNVGGADNWGQMQKLTDDDAAAGDEFGWAVTLSGPTVAVGAPYDDVGAADVGSAYVFRQTVDLEVSATESIDPVIAGSGTPNLTYTVTALNNGPEDAAGVALSVDLTLPPGVSVASITPSGTTTFATTTAPDGLWTVGTLVAGASETLTVALTAVSSTAAGSDVIGSTATVTSAYGIDTDTGNDSATLATSVALEADLGLSKTDGAVSAVPGESLVYTIVASNQGPSDAAPVSVADTFPAALTCSFSSVAAGGATGNTSGSGNPSETLSMPAASSVTWTVTCTIDSGATGTLSNTAAISSAVTDPVPGNNSATDNDTVLVPETDLEITQSDAPDPVVAGTNVTYALTAANQGPSDATGVVVTDTLPPGVHIVTASSPCAVAGRVVICTAGDLAAGASVLFDIAATVDSAATGPITNTAEVSGNETDPNLPNTVAETTTIVAEADLAITKSAVPDPVAAGSNLTWTLQVSNHGPSTATGVVATDALPAGVSLVSASPECSAVGDLVTCPAGELAVGTGAEFTLEVMVDPAATGSITNTAEVSGVESDPAAGNNRAVATAAIALAADLVLSQSDSADPALPGDELTWTVTVTNHGPDDAEEVVVTDALPEGVALVATSGCAEDPAGTPACTLGTIAAGESRSYELTVAVDPGVAGTLLHSADASSAVAEAQPGDESSTETTEVVGDADLAVELSGPPAAVPGGEVHYTLTVTNLGPGDAIGVQVLDYFVPELVDVSWSRTKGWQGQGVLAATASGVL
ncbi:MAG: DUF11 domain-containing protein, partial [bacterium]|nr:DUF11 domain-containing protein [bacterium]